MFVLLKNTRCKGCDIVCSQWRSTRFNTGRQALMWGNMVRKERLELSRHKTLEPKSSASTNSATSAQNAGETLTGLPTRRGILS